MKWTTLLPPAPGERAFFLAALLWMALVFFHYHAPASFLDFSELRPLAYDFRVAGLRGFGANAAGFLKILSCFLAVLLTLWRWGRKLHRRLGLEEGNKALRFCVESALGVLFFNNLWLGLGLNGLWRGPLLRALALLFFGGALWDLLCDPPSFRGFPKFKNPGKAGTVLAALGAATFLLCLAQCLVPEVYYDALVYHLSTLRFWEYHHGIADFYTNLYSYYPFGQELYLMNGFFFQGGEGAKMLDALATFLCALAAAGWVAEERGLGEACLAWALVWAFPLTSTAAWDARNDVLLAFFILLFTREAWKWSGRGGGRGALAAGLWAGAALSVKYTAVLWILIPLLVRGWMARKEPSARRGGGAGLFGAALGLLAAPWLLKNFSFTGNAFYPYLSAWMGGKALASPGFRALMADHQAAFGGGFNPWDWIRRVTAVDLDKTIAPALFSFLPFLFLPARRTPVTRYLGTLAGLSLVAGFLVSHQVRLLMPGFVLCFTAMAMAQGEWKAGAWTRAWGALTALLGFWSLLALLRMSVGYYQSDRVWLGLQTPQAYLASNPQTSSYYGLTRAVGELLPPDDRILVAGDARGLYYPRSFYTNSAFDEPVLARLARAEKDGQGIARRLREMGIDDLAVSGVEGARLAPEYDSYGLPPEAWRRLEDFMQEFTDPVYLKGGTGIYRLRSAAARGRAPIPDLLLLLKKPGGGGNPSRSREDPKGDENPGVKKA